MSCKIASCASCAAWSSVCFTMRRSFSADLRLTSASALFASICCNLLSISSSCALALCSAVFCLLACFCVEISSSRCCVGHQCNCTERWCCVLSSCTGKVVHFSAVPVRKSSHCSVLAPVSVQSSFVMLRRSPYTSIANNVSKGVPMRKYTVVFHVVFA